MLVSSVLIAPVSGRVMLRVDRLAIDMGERGRQRERQTERERDRQTKRERQTDRQTDRDRQTD